jgi:hypothetical protein
MKIDSNDSRVRPDEKINLKERPTMVQRLFKSKMGLSQTPERTH